jgi:hypothetical protein
MFFFKIPKISKHVFCCPENTEPMARAPESCRKSIEKLLQKHDRMHSTHRHLATNTKPFLASNFLASSNISLKNKPKIPKGFRHVCCRPVVA